MRISIFILSMLFSVQLMVAQSAEDEVIRLKQSMGEQAPESRDATVTEEEGLPGHWNLSVGTSFTYMQGYGSAMGFYAAPMYTLPLNDRWALHGGLIASNYTGLGSLQMPGGEFRSSNNFSSLAVFAAASYKMTDRLILHGSGYKNLTSYPLMPMAPGLVDNLSMGATYKLGNNISIGASISINQGHGYYQAPPFGGASFGSPFASPFGW
ncbi:MAG: hypothetical protein R6W31_01440 [Bacteroidales bacterium]